MKKSIQSFTLVELLIVIAILAVLAAAVVVVLNPAELLAEARDSQRVSDLDSMKKSISLWALDNPGGSEGTAQVVYTSLPDTSSTCSSYSLPTLPSGWAYHCVTTSNSRNIDGSGWIPLNFSTVKGGSPLTYLPLDPANDAPTGRYYTYTPGGSYELTALMEAEKHEASINDGGSLPGVYQVGTHIGLTPPTRDEGLVGYWTFDEGSGTTAYDSSGKGNNGTWSGPDVHYIAGKVGPYSASFNELNGNSINCGAASSLNFGDRFSFMFWMKGSSPTTIYYPTFASKRSGTPIGWQTQIGAYGPTIYMRIDNSAGTNQTSGSLTVLDNTWHHAVFVIDNGNKRYYLDGVQVYSGTYNIGNGMSVPTTPFQIGGTMPAQMDDVRLYNRTLSSSEIKAIYDMTK